ncbi:MAG: phosphoglycerate kinase [Candidatus Anoxymicrobium japonicum]|uniref:Phosphoglycerate kinase n=1 Tax=Candidatus Anoxymicrobium japonicum TaxID=2013648 RepID=A0A2N3G6A7_9ACTN|nr:MAG: phosphoglycerate kinase [Candidatus Anoxymicrobium japonicum]
MLYPPKKTIRDIDVSGKKALVRVDFNVPLDIKRNVVDDTRIRGALPTINYLLDHGAHPILMSHLGRPRGKIVESLRMAPVGKRLSELLGRQVVSLKESVGPRVIQSIKENEDAIILLENLRFYPGERENLPNFSKHLAQLADVYVNDAFGACHRAHASITGVTRYLPAVMGLLMEKELETLGNLMEDPERPFVVVLGGNKISDKLGVINSFLDIADFILTGGGLCFTVIKSMGLGTGQSVIEVDQIHQIAMTMKRARKKGSRIVVPVDFVVADRFDRNANFKVVPTEAIPSDWMGLDIGPRTVEKYRVILKEAKTIFWNGPMGVFEWPSFANGTKSIAECIACASAVTVVGGGDSDAALRQYGLEDKMDFVSTGGGAAMRLLEGKKLPAVEVLADK